MGSADRDRDRSAGMRTQTQRNRMIRQDRKRQISAFQSSHDGLHDLVFEIGDRLHLMLKVPFVGTLIDGFQMDIDEIMIFDGFDRGLRLPGVIGIEISGRPLDRDHIHSGAFGYAGDHIHSSDDCSGLSRIFSGKTGKSRLMTRPVKKTAG